MVNPKDESLTSEVESRLDELFSDEDDSGSFDEESERIETEESGDSKLQALNAVILSIDWEINDETMAGLFSQLDQLKSAYESDQMVMGFLKILTIVGKYIDKNKANAHPDAIKLLNSVYGCLKKVIDPPDLSEKKQKQLLSGELAKLKQLKHQIAMKSNKGVAGVSKPADKKTGEPGKMEKAAATSPNLSKELQFVLDELKKVIRSEFKMLIRTLEAGKKS